MLKNQKSNVEKFIRFWNLWDYIFKCLLTILLSFSGFSILLAYLSDHFFPNLQITYVFIISGTISVFYTIFVLFRNKLIIKIFTKRSHISFQKLLTNIDYVFFVFGIPLFLIFIGEYLLKIEVFNTYPTVSILNISIFLIYTPVNSMFANVLTKSGKTTIEFEQVFLNLNNFSERQKWLTKVFKKLENLLREGRINIPHDKLLFYLNFKLLKSENVEDSLREIENWMLSDQRDDSILISLNTFLPEKEIEPLKKIPLIKQLTNIHPEYFKYIIIFIVIVIIAVVKPELIENFFEFLFKS